ncbi:AIPR family protein [uncultured Sunxiuqinia sp.]|uniref:AIPR family protein n=1 Tax=uncultured Sunxiuqinia sp. TaxID=1573825 RepID=UPI002AA7C14E|nr:AIPR family protein [uncultured Sunxiuqinia sp.]
MTTNQQIILDTLLDQQKKQLDSTLKEDEYFHLFVTEQVLKNFELSYDELQEGIVDNGGDGGIDAIYTLVNSELIQRDTELIDGKRNSVIDVYIIQSKNTTGFGETPIEKCTSSANDLFDFTKSSEQLKTVYNNELLTNREVFKNQYLHLASKFPILKFHYFYASKGNEVHDNVSRKVENLRDIINKHFDKAEINFDFLTAGKLIELSRREQIKTKGITLLDSPIATQDGGYIAIAPLKNYFDFISDENGDIIKYFFDSNIRDYQGSVEVNSGIKETLMTSNPTEDFWWLNNGITITASDATFGSKILQIEEPQIVNGLQTSFEIYNYFRLNKVENDGRNVLVRVVKTKDEKSRLKVIKSTNFQTNIPPASLRATDPIHRDIEDYLFAKGFYYDRRKNYHKNQQRPINKIVSIPHLAQIVMAALQQKPDYARARPSTIIKNNSDYDGIFNASIPIELYFKLVSIHQSVENKLKTFCNPKLTRPQIGDIKFHVSMYVVGKLTNKIKSKAQEIANINLENLTDEIINEAIENTFIVYDSMGGNNSIAKGKEFVKEVLEQLGENLEDKKIEA